MTNIEFKKVLREKNMTEDDLFFHWLMGKVVKRDEEEKKFAAACESNGGECFFCEFVSMCPKADKF